MQAIVLRTTENLSPTEWLSMRKQGIGGSDAAAVCGLSRWKSPIQVWLEKTGQTNPEHAGEAAYWGQVMEPILRKEFSIRTGLEVNPLKSMLQHRRFPFMLANLDGIVTDLTQGQGVFEAKTAGLFASKEWDDKLPDEYAIQVQHYLAVTGLPFAYVAVLIGGNHFKWLYIERDPGAIDLIIQLEARFWRLVETRTPPPIDSSKASSELLNRLYPHGQNQQIHLPLEALDLIEVYESAKGR
ncbi:phage-related [hydrocarbon metagenome]|uniref:Phage-related n=1 Tax=hydrocarbon metagenome TaxID=938273 RepID=A0A0W8E6M4_9ZZZZ